SMGSEQEFVIPLEVDKVSELGGKTSKIHYFADLPWHISVNRFYCGNNTFFLRVYIHCNEEGDEREWNCASQCTVRLLHSSGDENLAAARQTFAVHAQARTAFAIDMITWNEVIDQAKILLNAAFSDLSW
ncbi:hypothetical protein PFISCL1PPCAC_21283, partial [Pristionchus fissidentatus]